MTDDLLTYRLDQIDRGIAAVLIDLRAHVADDTGKFEKLDARFDKLHDDVLTLKMKATLWGAVGAGTTLLLGMGAQALGFHF